jgi:uncharacterized Zn-binding protein involved in type VI secretion
MKLAQRTSAALLVLLVASSLMSAAQEPVQATLYACVEREDAYLARTGITDALGIDNPASGGLVLTSAKAVTPNPRGANVSGDYLISNNTVEAQIVAAVGTRVQVAGFIRNLRVRTAANGQTLPRRMAVTEWHAAGACSPQP